MLDHELRRDEGILVLRPEGPLAAEDFRTLAAHVDAYLEQRGTLHGVFIHAKAFPGWKDFGALLAHLKFIKDHHLKIEKVAVVADGGIATILPFIARHFIHAQVRHFDYTSDQNAAWAWLMDSSQRQTRRAALGGR